MIIVALFIVALIAAMAYTMMARLSRDTRETALLTHSVQAEYFAQGSIAWGLDQLRDNLSKLKPDQLVDVIPIKAPEKTVDSYTINGTIYDLQARFNLNNLTDKKYQDQMLRLIKLVLPNLSHEEAAEIVNATVDWITPSAQQSKYNTYYFELPKPYRAAHRPMANASELKLVKGVSPNIYAALQPYIVALPTNTKINMQTAAAPVLASLSDKVSLQDANAIVELRKQKPLSTNPAAYELDVLKSGRFPLDEVVVVSQYFLIETKVTIDDQLILLYTLVNRESKDGRPSLNIIGQSKGTW